MKTILFAVLICCALVSVSMAGVLPQDENLRPIQMHNPRTTQTISLSTTSAASTAFSGKAIVEIYCTADCFVAIGAAPTATTVSMFVPAETARQVLIDSGDKIAGILAADTGTMRLTY